MTPKSSTTVILIHFHKPTTFHHLLEPTTVHNLAHHWHKLKVVSKYPQNEKYFTLAISRQSFPDNQALLITTTSTTTRLSPWILLQSILEHSGSLQRSYFGSITSWLHKLVEFSRNIHSMNIKSSCMYVSMIKHAKNFQKIILQLASKQPRQPAKLNRL